MRRETRRLAVSVAAGAVLALALVACRRTTINQVLAEPARYANQEVTVGGQVVKSASVLGRGAYQIDDGTGTLWVVTKRGAPRQGARVAVTGRVRDVVNLGEVLPLPPEVASGLVMIETEHRAQ
jgi:DNA/RNA endonuclease YhcR with UshA esterase domain